MASLYERLGGEATIDQVVEIFYRKVLSDCRIQHFFDGIEMAQQIARQKVFLSMIFSGPDNYSGRGMREGHRSLVMQGLNDSHFDVIVELLGATLRELSVDEPDIQEMAVMVNHVRDDVFNR